MTELEKPVPAAPSIQVVPLRDHLPVERQDILLRSMMPFLHGRFPPIDFVVPLDLALSFQVAGMPESYWKFLSVTPFLLSPLFYVSWKQFWFRHSPRYLVLAADIARDTSLHCDSSNEKNKIPLQWGESSAD